MLKWIDLVLKKKHVQVNDPPYVTMSISQPVSLTRPRFNPEQKWALRVQPCGRNLVRVDPVQIFTNPGQISLQKFKNPEPKANQ